MYHQDPVINDLMLTIINDGDGSQCGMNYAQRCAAADTGIFYYRAACREYNRHASREQIIEAATRIQAYYREHVKESA